MANVISENKLLPMRGSVLLLLALNLLISAITGLNFLSARENFPSWFGPVFLLAIGLFICIICFYIWQLPRTLELVKPATKCQAGLIWLLLVLSVICTSSLHQFAPFRPDAIMFWPEIPPEYNILKYNFILTAGSLLVVLVLAILYCLGRAYEENGDTDKALEIFRKLAQVDFAYKDVSQRVDRLRSIDN